MSDPRLWYGFVGLFLFAGLLNLVKGLRRVSPRYPVHLALAVSCLLWAGAAYLFRFVGMGAGCVLGAAAIGAMLVGALLSARASQ